MAFWTRFIKRKSPLLEAQEPALTTAGIFKKILGFLVRQKPFWISIGLSLTLIAGATYWVIKIQPYSDLGKKVGIVIEAPPAGTREIQDADRTPADVIPEIPEIKQGVVESRAQAESLLRAAETLYRVGQLDRVKDHLKQAISLTADTGLLSVAYANLANILDGEGRYNEAVQYLQRALTFNPKFVDGYHNLGIVYLHLHEFDKAQLAFQMAIRESPEFAPSRAGLGEVHVTLGRFPDAIREFSESLRLRDDPGIRLSLGLAYLHGGGMAQAIEQFTLAQNSAADPYIKYLAYFNRAYALDALRRYDEAATDYKAALALVSKDLDATFNLGLALMESKKKEEALAAFRRVIELDPDHMDAYLNAVTLMSDLGQYQAALDLIRPVHERIPNHKRVNYLLGHLYHRLGKLPESHAAFNRVLAPGREEIPSQLKTDALAGLASVFDDSGDLPAAETMYREALHLGNYSYLHYNLSRTLRRARKLDEAVKESMTALDLEPGNYTFVLALAEVLYDAEQLTKAFDIYKQAAEMSPRESYPRFMMAFTASRQRLWSTALAEFNRLIAGNISDDVRAAVHKGIGNVHHEQGNFPEALAAYKAAAAIAAKDSSLFYNIARTYFQMGRFDECFSAIQKSIQLDPKSSEAHTLLGTYYFKKGLMQKAHAAFEEAVRINPENLEAFYNRDTVRKYQ